MRRKILQIFVVKNWWKIPFEKTEAEFLSFPAMAMEAFCQLGEREMDGNLPEWHLGSHRFDFFLKEKC